MLSWAEERRSFAYFVSCGMGKTAVTLKELERRFLNGQSRGALIVAPVRVCSITWPNQIALWEHSSWMRVAQLRTKEGLKAWNEGSADIYLINPEQLPKLVPLMFKGRKSIPVDTFVIDECFPSGTLVDTPSGKRKIEEIQKGDCVLNVYGEDSVVQTKRNVIHEAILIRTADRREIISSPTHKFFTRRGWVEAKKILQEKDHLYPTNEAMSLLRSGVHHDIEESEPSSLRAIMRSENDSSCQEGETVSDMPVVRTGIHLEGLPPKEVLRNELLCEMENEKPPLAALDRGREKKNIREEQEVACERESFCTESHRPHNSTLPDEESRVSGKTESHSEENRSQSESPRRKREAHARSAEVPSGISIGGVGSGVRSGAGEKTTGLPNVLQDRHCQPGDEDSHRGGWGESQLSLSEDSRPQEGRETDGTRVESVEVLKQGDPRLERFRDADGLIYFYDLEVRRHPSYSVEGFLVHNCSLAKNPTSVRFNAIRPYLPMFKDGRIGLTGTPVPNNYLDLFAQIRLLDDGQRLGRSFSQYRQAYFTSDWSGYTWTINPGAKEIIDAKIADLCLVMLGDDYLDLPTCSTEDIQVTLPAEAKAAYKKLEKELLLELEKSDVVALNMATLSNKLLQLTGGSIYGEERVVNHIHTAKIDALLKLRKKHKKEPMLVLTSFKHESARILEAIPGAQKFDEKDLDKWKRGEIHTWVSDPRSLAFGIDGLQIGGRIAVWFTMTWSQETYIQANARLVRTGQSSETLIYRIICGGTIDDAVCEAIREKSDTQSGLLNALKALQKLKEI